MAILEKIRKRTTVLILIIGGVAAACSDAGIALLGGETAEMPGVYAPGEFDLAGTIVGPVLGVSLSLYAVRGVEVGVASALMQLSPVFLLPLAAAFSHERISRRSLGGTLVAVAGAGLLFLVA